MTDAPERKPLLPGRGAISFHDFCVATGLDVRDAEGLMADGRLPGALWRDKERTAPFGLLDDTLPSREDLVALGLAVRADYDPANHRSVVLDEDDDD